MRLPFGLNSSPAGLLRSLVKIFAGKLGGNIYLYMDDILLANETWQGHLETIEDTLHTLEINELSCNPSKCMFGMPKLEFLGFEISRDGIKISRRKLAAIEKIAPPKNRKSLQRILGLINFWRKNAPADALSRTLEDMSSETRLEFAPELNVKDDFIVSITTDELPSEQASDISERERESELQINAKFHQFAVL